jgi:hypothetical protein
VSGLAEVVDKVKTLHEVSGVEAEVLMYGYLLAHAETTMFGDRELMLRREHLKLEEEYERKVQIVNSLEDTAAQLNKRITKLEAEVHAR